MRSQRPNRASTTARKARTGLWTSKPRVTGWGGERVSARVSAAPPARPRGEGGRVPHRAHALAEHVDEGLVVDGAGVGEEEEGDGEMEEGDGGDDGAGGDERHGRRAVVRPAPGGTGGGGATDDDGRRRGGGEGAKEGTRRETAPPRRGCPLGAGLGGVSRDQQKGEVAAWRKWPRWLGGPGGEGGTRSRAGSYRALSAMERNRR